MVKERAYSLSLVGSGFVARDQACNRIFYFGFFAARGLNAPENAERQNCPNAFPGLFSGHPPTSFENGQGHPAPYSSYKVKGNFIFRVMGEGLACFTCHAPLKIISGHILWVENEISNPQHRGFACKGARKIAQGGFTPPLSGNLMRL